MSRLVAETLADNWRMVAVFTDAGLPVRIAHRDGVVHVELDLSQRP